MKVLCWIGIAFFVYCQIMVTSQWKARNAIEKTIWFVVNTVGVLVCVTYLMRH